MSGLLSLTLPALIAALAWIYQKTWERHERRVKYYSEFIKHLPAFTVGSLDADKIDEAIDAARQLWIIAPDSVIEAMDRFLTAGEGGKSDEEKERIVGELILAIRQDASFRAALLPRLQTRLTASDFKIRTANRLTIRAPTQPQ